LAGLGPDDARGVIDVKTFHSCSPWLIVDPPKSTLLALAKQVKSPPIY